MKELTEKEIVLLNQMAAGIITKEQLLQKLVRKFTYEEIEKFLDDFIIKNQFINFESIFFHIPHSLNKESECKLYRKYLLVKGHYQHENIVTAFQTYFNEDKNNVDFLLQAITDIPDYLHDEDMRYPYIKKILYAISAQPHPYNLDALKKISKSEDLKIRDLALRLIEKLQNNENI